MVDRISLSAQYLIDAGTDHACYRHPSHPEFCIKILLPERHSRRFRREIRYYRRLQERRIDWYGLARYHGQVETNLGPGALFDLISDHDGRVSRSLDYYLRLGDAAFDAWVIDELNQMTRDFHRYWVVFHDLNPGNLLVRRLDENRKYLVAVDGIGHNHFLPVANYSPGFARRKIARVWNRRFRQWYAPYPAVVAGLERFETAKSRGGLANR